MIHLVIIGVQINNNNNNDKKSKLKKNIPILLNL